MKSDWVPTNIAAAELGLSPRQLRKLKPQATPGKHYRVMNRESVKPRLLWHVTRCQELLQPLQIVNKQET